MVRKFVSATVSAALCLMSVAPVMAQEYRSTVFDAPRGATATVNLRVPLGGGRDNAQQPSYGLTASYGQTVGSPTPEGRPITRAVNVADLRFSGDGLRNARIAGFDLAHLDRYRQMYQFGDGANTIWIVVGLVAAGVAICLLAECFEDDEEESSSSN